MSRDWNSTEGYKLVHGTEAHGSIDGVGPKHCCVKIPWFIVTSQLGPIKIGWRKRVISIEWKDSAITADGEQLFKDQDVTKWKTGIHAWSYVLASTYLTRLKESMSA